MLWVEEGWIIVVDVQRYRNPTQFEVSETRYSHGWNECGMNSYSDRSQAQMFFRCKTIPQHTHTIVQSWTSEALQRPCVYIHHTYNIWIEYIYILYDIYIQYINYDTKNVIYDIMFKDYRWPVVDTFFWWVLQLGFVTLPSAEDQPLPERPAMVGPPQTPRTAGAIDACCGSWPEVQGWKVLRVLPRQSWEVRTIGTSIHFLLSMENMLHLWPVMYKVSITG